MRLLLINPRFPESFWSFRWAVDHILPRARTVNPPLGLATLAGLCPPDWEVQIVDENVETVPLAPEADLIGVCGMGVQFERQKELLSYYRERGNYVVAGGSYASLCPEAFEGIADSVIAGEAEYIWREFCRDFAAGRARPLYHETGEVSLHDSPTPRFDLLDTSRYGTVSLQFSRGCPFRCEFCDIIVMFGRKPRTKAVEQVGAELDRLRALGVHDVFFVDDNLIGNRNLAKELLRYLADYQRRYDYAFRFGTEASLNLARDDELLDLFRAANFEWIFIGIESPDEESLKETKKLQNTRTDILADIRKIYGYGMDVLAGFIIGFDNDTTETFEKQYRFIMDSGIQSAMIGLLMAVEKTPLYERLQKEGRLVSVASESDNSKLATNVIPKNMSYDEMVSGYRALHFRLLEHKAIAERIRNKLRYYRGPARSRHLVARDGARILAKVVGHIASRGGVRGLYHFARSLPVTRPRLIPFAVHDWVIGLSMRDYVDRHFTGEPDADRRRARWHADRIRRVLDRYLQAGSLRVSLDEAADAGGAPSLRLSLKGRLGRDFFRGASRQLERMLRDTRSSLTLCIEEFHAPESEALQKMLSRLHRYGDRVRIAADEHSRRIIGVDSSIFVLSMESI